MSRDRINAFVDVTKILMIDNLSLPGVFLQKEAEEEEGEDEGRREERVREVINPFWCSIVSMARFWTVCGTWIVARRERKDWNMCVERSCASILSSFLSPF